MLDYNTFKQYYSTCHLLCGGIDVPQVAMNLAYQKFKNDFDDKTFIKVSNMIVEEVKGYSNLIPMSEWYERKEKAELNWEENLQMYLDNLALNPEDKIKQKMVNDFVLKHPERTDVKEYIERCKIIEAKTGKCLLPKPEPVDSTPEMSSSEFLRKLNIHGLKVVS